MKSAPGEDGLSYRVLIHVPAEMIELISEVYNICLNSGYYPKAWKAAIGIMLPKPNKDPQVAINYRPISLLKCVGKIYEKVIANRLVQHMEDEGHFNKWQRAYLRQKEAGEHVFRLGTTAKKSTEGKWYTGAVLLDVEKAFDSVWHAGLKYKIITKYGLPNKMLRILSSFVDDRTIKVKIGDSISKVVKLNAGTPQGSVLSPILFLMYVNDLPIDSVNKTAASQFADDMGLWASSPCYNRVIIRL